MQLDLLLGLLHATKSLFISLFILFSLFSVYSRFSYDQIGISPVYVATKNKNNQPTKYPFRLLIMLHQNQHSADNSASIFEFCYLHSNTCNYEVYGTFSYEAH